MGCDIHCYIEYKRKDWNSWSPFGGCINPGRNYRLFAALAGVRNAYDILPVVEPRGYPTDAAYMAESDNWLFVRDGKYEGHCSRESAERYVASCGSRYKDSEKAFVSNPDWHSHSWLTPDEYGQAIGTMDAPGYRAILAAMRSFETDGHKARIIFWFDN